MSRKEKPLGFGSCEEKLGVMAEAFEGEDGATEVVMGVIEPSHPSPMCDGESSASGLAAYGMFVAALPEDLRCRVTRYPYVDGGFIEWLPVVFDRDEAMAAAHALVKSSVAAWPQNETALQFALGLEEYLSSELLYLTLVEDHDDMHMAALQELVTGDLSCGIGSFSDRMERMRADGAGEIGGLLDSFEEFERVCPHELRGQVPLMAQFIVGVFLHGIEKQ
ncbi:MAG: hypothetical protein Q4B77_06445 [Coriobacteriaceae bacterium]|nr:hypothetical protein [Coriobacteriaceae bacterium]